MPGTFRINLAVSPTVRSFSALCAAVLRGKRTGRLARDFSMVPSNPIGRDCCSRRATISIAAVDVDTSGRVTRVTHVVVLLPGVFWALRTVICCLVRTMDKYENLCHYPV